MDIWWSYFSSLHLDKGIMYSSLGEREKESLYLNLTFKSAFKILQKNFPIFFKTSFNIKGNLVVELYVRFDLEDSTGSVSNRALTDWNEKSFYSAQNTYKKIINYNGLPISEGHY